MTSISYKYSLHVDNLRRSHGLSTEDFVDGVCSKRAYARYITGERDIPHKVLVGLCSRIGIRYNDFFYSFQKYHDNEYNKISKLHRLFINKKFNDFQRLNKEISQLRVIDKFNSKLLTYLNIRYALISSSIHDAHAYEKFKNLLTINIQSDTSLFDFIDVIVLIEMMKIELKQKSYQSMEILLSIVKSNKMKYLSSSNKDIFPNIFATISIALGRTNRFKDSYDVAIMGIDYSLEHNNNSALTLLYYLVFCYFNKIGDVEKEKYINLCIASEVANSSSNNGYYRNLIEKDLKNEVTVFL